MTLHDADLKLDESSLHVDELSMAALAREISLHKRPSSLLMAMMNALETKRAAKGYGWSRPWNKYGSNTFRTHTCDATRDADYLAPLLPFLEKTLHGMPEPYASFMPGLFADPKVMFFTFYHNVEDDGAQYEGLTLSVGRKVVEDKTKRDRIDIILEDERIEGAVDGQVDRFRIYVCPWASYENKDRYEKHESNLQSPLQEEAQALYSHAIGYYHEWKSNEERQWSHWSSKYIDYFGPRTFIPQGSSFT